MNKSVVLGALGALLLVAVGASSAQAQVTRSWVSGVGDDTNPCSRTSPCKTWSGAFNKTAAGGEIDALDPGGFGSLTITKSITIASEGVGVAGVSVGDTTGFLIEAGVNDVVVIRGVVFDGLSQDGFTSLVGVNVMQAGTVEIQNSVIRNFSGASPNGFAIIDNRSTNPTVGQPNYLFISDTTITTNGAVGGTAGGGILIQPTGAASVTVALNNVNLVNNVLGFRADASRTSGSILTTISNSNVTGNAFAGVSAFTVGGSGTATINLIRTTDSTNGGAGVNANGANASIRLINSVVSENKTGVVVANSGVVSSTGNNAIYDNTSAGSTPVSSPAN